MRSCEPKVTVQNIQIFSGNFLYGESVLANAYTLARGCTKERGICRMKMRANLAP